MSENNENKDNPKEEIIESETVETVETVAVKKAEVSDEIAPVVVKKGGFFSFLAFLLAALALAGNAYLYLEMKKKDETVNNVFNNKEWQAAVSNVANDSEQKFTQFANQIKKMQKINDDLQKQIDSVKQIAVSSQSADGDTKVVTYDDSQLVQQINTLQMQLDTQVQSLGKIETTVLANNDRQNQAVQQLASKLTNPSPQQDRLTLINKSYKYEMAEHLLLAAHKQFNFYSNVVKGQDFLKQTIQQFSILEGEGYQNLALEIRKVSDEIKENPPIIITQVKNQVSQLDNLSSRLTFQQSITDDAPEENQSWYDKLVVIRKVKDEKGVKLTNAEQEIIYQDIANHYSAMKVALVSTNQSLWNEEIIALKDVLVQYFPTQSQVIIEQLDKLKKLDINPKMPDLTKYIDTLKELNSVVLSGSESQAPIIKSRES